ncbi:MAG: hypothetical protein ACRDYV_21810, partial [Acidimicrobiia bacterium]
MWPFRRQRRPEGQPDPGPAGPVPAGATAPAGHWLRLAPIQRTVGSTPLTVRADGTFRAGLAGPHNPRFSR